jgi:hypothetical protein
MANFIDRDCSMQRCRNAIYSVVASCLGTVCSAADQTELPRNMPLKQVGVGIFELGKIRLNKNDRTVTIPASINMREGTVEYLLVTSLGKTHESVLRTDAEPYHIHLAMLLLGAKGKGTNEFPADKTKAPPGDLIHIEVRCKRDDKLTNLRAEELIRDRAAKSAMQKLNWIYNGSQIGPEGFAAQHTGSIISLIDDPDALINNPLPRRENDDNWEASTGALPQTNGDFDVVLTLPASNNVKKNPLPPPTTK